MWPFRKKQNPDDIDKKRLQAFGVVAVTSSLCIGPNRLPVLCGNRKAPNNISDSGWILDSGRESQEFCDDPDNYKLVPLEMMIETDATLACLRDLPVGTEITRTQVTEPWRFIVDDKVVDEDGRVVGEIRHK